MTNEEAIDYLVGIKKYYTEDKDFGYYGDEYHGLTVKEKEALCLAISVLNHSATDINVATKDGDMVYRQDAIDALDCINCTEEVLRSLPSAQSEIIRCKDCKYRDENWRRVSVKWLPCMDVQTPNNWFCGSAERGEQDDEQSSH